MDSRARWFDWRSFYGEKAKGLNNMQTGNETELKMGERPFVNVSEGSTIAPERLKRMYSADLFSAHRTCEAIANLLTGPVPWVAAARAKAEDYAAYFKTELEKLGD